MEKPPRISADRATIDEIEFARFRLVNSRRHGPAIRAHHLAASDWKKTGRRPRSFDPWAREKNDAS